MKRVLRWLACLFLGHQCVTFETANGIGGVCKRCDRVFGFMTDDELRYLGP